MFGNRSCQAGPLATSESQRAERQFSGNAVFFRHQMRNVTAAEVFAHRNSGQAGANDERVHVFN
jgi:hypothetical protein